MSLGRIQELIDRLKKLEGIILEAIKSTLEQNEDLISEMNSEDQLFEKGITREGIKISDYAPYSPITIELKMQKGQPTNRVTLRDEGDFHYSFHIELTDEGFEIKASDWKTNDLMTLYGDEILGLTDDNFRDLANNYVAPAILNQLRQKL